MYLRAYLCGRSNKYVSISGISVYVEYMYIHIFIYQV